MVFMNTLIKREYDYAIRICAYLAGNYPKRHIPISEISKKLFISKPFTTKIIYRLKNSGIIETIQGKNGGAYLKHPPDKLSVLDILTAMGYDSTLNACLRDPEICPLIDKCKIHLFFAEEEAKLLKSFRSKKISEFAIHDDELALATNF